MGGVGGIVDAGGVLLAGGELRQPGADDGKQKHHYQQDDGGHGDFIGAQPPPGILHIGGRRTGDFAGLV